MQYNDYLAKDSSTANYSLNGVIEFLQEQDRSNRIKTNEWLLERQQLTVKYIPTHFDNHNPNFEYALNMLNNFV